MPLSPTVVAACAGPSALGQQYPTKSQKMRRNISVKASNC
jgi:hypothetical protein